MKLTKILVIALMGMSVLQACNKKSCHKEGHGEEVVVNQDVQADAEATLRVEGMMCEVGCKGTIEKTLRSTPGVAFAEIIFDENKAVIKYDSKQTDENKLIEIINNIGDHSYEATIWTDTPANEKVESDTTANDELSV